MYKTTILVLFVCLCGFSAQAQQTCSKMYDMFGEWEAVIAPFNISGNIFSIYGETRNFAATDSTKYSRGFISII